MKLIIEVTPSIKDNVIEHYQTSSNISCINQAYRSGNKRTIKIQEDTL